MNLTSIAHRPWDLPKSEWAIHMVWHDLLFLHWPIEPRLLRSLIPSQLQIDTFEKNAWIGIVPFLMSEVYSRGLLKVHVKKSFCELNVRTYVTYNGKPGVWFFSLDTESLMTVIGARLNFHLPYYFAKMKAVIDQDRVHYSSRRLAPRNRSQFSARYRPTSEAKISHNGTLEHWLTERYRLYTQTLFGRIAFSEIHHEPWPLQTAECEIIENTMHHTLPGLPPFKDKPIAHFAKRLEAVAWPLEQTLRRMPFRKHI